MSQIHRFFVPVNCNIFDDFSTEELQDCELIYDDSGFIILPDNYDEKGKPTVLVINCHGAGGTVTTDDSQVEHQALTKYLVANGFAVMDVNGLPLKYAEENGIDIRNNLGSPIAIQSYFKAYKYCMENFNLKPEVFVHGGSMGGISSTNLVLSGLIPVISHTLFCPVLDTYNQIFLHPWSEGISKIALSKLYKFDKNESNEYIYNEKKLVGYNPVNNKKSECYPVPLKAWHCMDDSVVSFEITEQFINRIKMNGGIARLRTFEYGGHEPQLVGDFIKKPCGIDVFEGEKIGITPAIEEVFIWIRKF